MKKVYLSGPYRSRDGMWGVWQNIQAAAQVARKLWMAGYAVFCPHLNTMLMDSGDPETGGDTSDLFLSGDLAWLRSADILVALPGSDGSKGAKIEIEEALRLGIPVYRWPEAEEILCADRRHGLDDEPEAGRAPVQDRDARAVSGRGN